MGTPFSLSALVSSDASRVRVIAVALTPVLQEPWEQTGRAYHYGDKETATHFGEMKTIPVKLEFEPVGNVNSG